MGLFDFLFGKKKETTDRQTNVSSKSPAHTQSSVSTAHAENFATPHIEQCFDPVTFSLSQIKSVKLGELTLAPYDASWFFQVPDAMVLPIFANTPKIKRFLPGMNFSTEEAAKKTLEGYIKMTELGLGITYFIRSQNIPIGMIFVNTPNLNHKVMNLHIWTVDFCIFESNEHKGIMFNCLMQVLAIMQQNFKVPKVYAVVDAANKECINLLYKSGNTLFEEEDNYGFKDKDHQDTAPRVFSLDLRTIRFNYA